MVQLVARRGQMLGRCLRLGIAGGGLQSAIQPFGHEALARRLAMEFETDVIEARRAEPLVDDGEGGHFLGHE